MSERFFEIELTSLSETDPSIQHNATEALEQGQVVYLPKLAFPLRLDEEPLLSESILSSRRKNVSFDIKTQKLVGIDDPKLLPQAECLLERYAHFSRVLVEQLFPAYKDTIAFGRTSYRPAEIDGRTTSKRQDDTRVHVDAFPSSPVQGKRILRVFCNINPYSAPRVWHLGDSFPKVLSTFISRVPIYSPLKAQALHLIKATKTLRSEYDHFMLYLHDSMKLDEHYQHTLAKQTMNFPAKSTWIVFTDQVSHAALQGQFLLEQTLYLPIDAMLNPSLSPLKQWESALGSCKISTQPSM
jgi:hypothetical protein